MILELRSTPSSTPISTISNSLVIISNYQLAQASIARIHWLDDSIQLKVSTLASSTLPESLSSSFVTNILKTHTHAHTTPHPTPKRVLFLLLFFFFFKQQQQQQDSILHAYGPLSFSGLTPASVSFMKYQFCVATLSAAVAGTQLRSLSRITGPPAHDGIFWTLHCPHNCILCPDNCMFSLMS